MAAFLKKPLSGLGTTNIPAAAPLVGAPLTLHTTDAVLMDEIWVYAWAVSTTLSYTLTLNIGGVLFQQTIPGLAGLIPVLPGIPVVGTGSAGTVITCYASTASAVWVTGYVIRISQ